MESAIVNLNQGKKKGENYWKWKSKLLACYYITESKINIKKYYDHLKKERTNKTDKNFKIVPDLADSIKKKNMKNWAATDKYLYAWDGTWNEI